ncbi:hypothetical protein [Curtobacterium sp. MCBD17_040]|uniref:hypothetical protein n=1 Tax=Curtobacterium sp. MCBD17_040 TaxID=2175674 RepID=UPI000DA9AC42|nr:hypothetical protein [Curtobacterium sp. MCBD17_040]WIB65444.1 hypothetical protein DEI94_18780 [Curtobacterium sp. MCBD17_040]
MAWSAGSVAQAWEHHRCHRTVDDVHLRWWKPDRHNTRVTLARARGGWSATGTIDEDTVPVRRHRRSPWGGGYWD